MTVNYVNKNVKARNINKKNLKRLEENKTKKLVMYKEPGIRITSDQKIMNGALPSKCWEKITTNLEFYTRINYQLNVRIE